MKYLIVLVVAVLLMAWSCKKSETKNVLSVAKNDTLSVLKDTSSVPTQDTLKFPIDTSKVVKDTTSVFPTKCGISCNNEEIVATYTSIKGKVFMNHTLDSTFAITINPEDLKTKTFTISNETIWVPCNLPDEFKVENLKVIISGNKKNCCKLLTQPYFRISYGCKFEITRIAKMN